MTDMEYDLISMADIARLAGRSRATVGNWKSRNPDDFPPERGRSPRGPLYDRSEAIEWLRDKGRLESAPAEAATMWELMDLLRGELNSEDATALILVLLAVRTNDDAWHLLRDSAPDNIDPSLRSIVLSDLPTASDLLPRDPLRPSVLDSVVGTLEQFDPASVPPVADALLEQASKATGRRTGEYFSPASVRRLVIGLAAPEGTIYNPACGVGQLLVDAAATRGTKGSRFVAQEVNRRVWAMATTNLRLHEIPANIELGDVFAEDRFPDLRADRVMAIPPWNQRLRGLEFLDDARWTWGEPGERDGNVAWIQHCLFHLADHGRAVIVLPNGVLFEGGRAGRIRQRMIRAGLLDAVVSLPAGLFEGTGIACSVLVFAKGRPTAGGKPAPTLMVDFGADAVKTVDRRSKALDETAIDEVIALHRSWVSGADPRDPRAAVASFDALVENDYVIDPGRYVIPPVMPPSLADLSTTRSALTKKLGALTDQTRQADCALQTILERAQ